MTKAQLQLDRELVESCVQLSPAAPPWGIAQSIWVAPPSNTIPSTIPRWLMLFERITRSTGPVARVLPSSKSEGITRPFSFGDRQRENSYVLTRLGATLKCTLKDAWPFDSASVEQLTTKAGLDVPEMRYSPVLSLLFESAKDRDLASLINDSINSRKILIWLCDILNGFCDQVRLIASSARFREKQKDFIRVPNENYRLLKGLVDECFIGNEHLYFSYVDLGYRENVDAKSVNFYKKTKADRIFLQDRIMKFENWPSTIIGYGLNLRYLPYNGYHYRLLLICQQKNREPAFSITTAIKNEWLNITEQNGTIFDHLFSIANQSLNSITRGDDTTRGRLVKKLYFLTQLDSLVQLKLPPKDRRFFSECILSK